jgi:NAD-dependent deacetylase
LWTSHNPLSVASLWAFNERPNESYRWVRPLVDRLVGARPNLAHNILAEWESCGRLGSLITQNIDSLHQAAGSQRVIELHGHVRTATCLNCDLVTPAEPLWQAFLATHEPPKCSECGGLLKPDAVLFGEPLSYESLAASQREALRCDLMLVIGTSLEVMPAADLPLLAKRRGARLILVNESPTALDDKMDVVLQTDVTEGLAALQQQVRD